MKDPRIISALIVSAAIIASVLIVMAPVYYWFHDGVHIVQCLHGFRNG